MKTDKEIVQETLSLMIKARMQNLFKLKTIQKGKRFFEAQEKKTLEKIKILENRINYEMSKHADTLNKD